MSVYAHAPEHDSGGPTVHTIPQPTLISIALQYSIDLHDLKLAILISEEVGRYEPENNKPNEYPYQYDVFEDRPPDPSDPDLTQAEMEQIRAQIAMKRALNEQHGDRQ